MSGFREYLLSVTASSLLLSLGSALVPNGTQKRVLNFVGSLVVILAVLSPVLHLNYSSIAQAAANLQLQIEELMTGVEVGNRDIQAQLIKEQCMEYILEKAEAMEVTISMEIIMEQEKGVPYPYEISIESNASDREKQTLKRIISQDIGIPEQRQYWSERK